MFFAFFICFPGLSVKIVRFYFFFACNGKFYIKKFPSVFSLLALYMMDDGKPSPPFFLFFYFISRTVCEDRPVLFFLLVMGNFALKIPSISFTLLMYGHFLIINLYTFGYHFWTVCEDRSVYFFYFFSFTKRPLSYICVILIY